MCGTERNEARHTVRTRYSDLEGFESKRRWAPAILAINSGRSGGRGGGSSASKIILETNDVVFPEIFTALHFDEDQILGGRIFHPVRRADGNIDGFAVANRNLAPVESDLRGTGNYDPVFCSLGVFLVTQTLSGQHLDPFDFEGRRFFQHGVRAPRASVKFSHSRDPPRHLTTKKPPTDLSDPQAAWFSFLSDDYEPARNVK